MDNSFDSLLNASAVPQDEKVQAFIAESRNNRNRCYELSEQVTAQVATDGKMLQKYLDVQSTFDRYTTNNALLILAQRPDAQKLGDYGYWREHGFYLKRMERQNPVLILEPGKTYKREDGTVGNYYNAKKLYDISQTTMSDTTIQKSEYEEHDLIRALVSTPPVNIVAVEPEQMSDEKGAFFKPEESCIYVRKGISAQEIFQNLVPELVFAGYADGNPHYDKNEDAFHVSCNDPFWDTAASMLLLALIFFLRYEAPEEEQNFPMVMEMLRAGEVREDDDQYQSPLDELFERLEMKNPEHIAVKYYKDYHSGSAKTLKSIQITLAARLEKFNLSSLAALTATDDLDLPSLGERKVALFALIPDNDTSYNFLVSILYTQLFQQLFYLADHKYGGRLPVHVHFLMDEFANVSLPDDFDKILSVMRSREVSVSIILQNLAQLKALFEKQWESIMGNCDEFLYLGGNEQGTHKYVSELLGKATIDTNTYGKSTGHSGNYSTNYQNTGRELMTPDEVRMLDNRYAILFIRGERPILDEKFDILKHPNVELTTDGNGKPYLHGTVGRAVANISLGDSLEEEFTDDSLESDDYELLSDEDLEEIIQKYQ